MSTKSAKNPAPQRQRVLLVDDHPLIREGIANWINREPDLEVCCQAANADEAMKSVGRQRPDIVVTDLTMPGRNGLELIKDLRAMHPKLPILVLSRHDELIYASRALRAGATGYLLKDAGGESLVSAVRHVLRGGVYVSPSVAEKILGTVTRRWPHGSISPIEQLSDREFEVFELVGRGYDSHKIGLQLRLSPRTVDVHRANIKRKLGLESSAALLHHAMQWIDTEQGGT